MTDLLTLENTAIVMDSTCDPPDGWFDQPGLYMVPLKVHFGDQMFRDGVDMTYKEFFAKLEASDVLPTTSQPTAGEFVAAYEEALKQYEHVFSLHISGEMSGTVRAAEQAAEQFDNVYVYDMRTVTSALALGAERLRARLAQGISLDDAQAYVEKFRDESHVLIHAATLEYLRRGGRIGPAASFVGGVFDIKPLIAAVDGDADRLRQGPRPQEGHGRDPAVRRGAQQAGRRDSGSAPSTPTTTPSPTRSASSSRASGPTPTTCGRATWRRSSARTSAPARRPTR